MSSNSKATFDNAMPVTDIKTSPPLKSVLHSKGFISPIIKAVDKYARTITKKLISKRILMFFMALGFNLLHILENQLIRNVIKR